MSGSGPLFTVIVTIALGGAILYILQRLRRTDKEVQLLQRFSRQIVDIGKVKTIVRQSVQEHQQKHDIDIKLIEEIVKDSLKDATGSIRGEVEEEKNFNVSKEEETADKKSPRLSFDNFEQAKPTEISSFQGSIRRLAAATDE